LAAQLTLAEAREQARLAQLLHDDLQQQLYAVAFALHGLRPCLEGDEKALGQVQKIKGLLNDAVATSRTTTAHLSPPVLRHEGLSEALKWLGNDIAARYDLHVIVDLPPDLVIPNEATRVLLFNIARELLFNVLKHAGVAEATLALGQDSEHFSLVVRDFGLGFDTADKGGTGLGHQEMRQRLNLFGGRLELSSTPGEGTQATISLPVAHFSLG
jgi:signal transduction histidine kinase